MAMLPPPTLTAKDEQRFWSHVDKSGECWEWMASKGAQGYGIFYAFLPGSSRQRHYRAHRVAFMIENGYYPKLMVCHHCDNPSCVRPDHLFAGTSLDNNQDKIAKGRARYSGNKNPPRGMRSGKAKLTDDDVRAIRRRYRRWNGPHGGVRSNAVPLAEEYGISRWHVTGILKGKRWRHLLEDPPHPEPDQSQ